MTAPVPVGGDGIDSIEAVLAFHRCSDVHPDRHDQGGVGVCTACRSWAAHVAAALRASAPEDGLRAAVEALEGVERRINGRRSSHWQEHLRTTRGRVSGRSYPREYGMHDAYEHSAGIVREAIRALLADQPPTPDEGGAS